MSVGVHHCLHLPPVLILPKVPVILVGNKIDLRGGEVTNKSLEDEIKPIMADFKVRNHITPESVSAYPVEWCLGSRDVRRMLRKNSFERLRGVLLRSEGSPPPNGSLI
jgi:hypothetical protein